MVSLAEEHGIKSIAFPNISTGIYKFPKDLAAKIVIDMIKEYVQNIDSQIEKVIFICFDKANFSLYRDRLKWIFHKQFGIRSISLILL